MKIFEELKTAALALNENPDFPLDDTRGIFFDGAGYLKVERDVMLPPSAVTTQ